MTLCPFCGHQNLPGADECDECRHSLTHLSRPRPRSEAEKRIVTDRIRALQPRPPLVVNPSTQVSDVLDLLVRERIGCVVVADQGRPLGIFSERDALMRLGTRYEGLLDRPISEFMTPSPETLSPDDKIAYALHRMDLGGFRHIPLVLDGQVMGVISVRDILRYVTQQVLDAVP